MLPGSIALNGRQFRRCLRTRMSPRSFSADRAARCMRALRRHGHGALRRMPRVGVPHDAPHIKMVLDHRVSLLAGTERSPRTGFPAHATSDFVGSLHFVFRLVESFAVASMRTRWALHWPGNAMIPRGEKERKSFPETSPNMPPRHIDPAILFSGMKLQPEVTGSDPVSWGGW